MVALADGLQQLGYRVTGSDEQVYPPMSERLAELGIAIQQGYAPANIPPDTDWVVVGNVIRESNPEAREMRRRGLPFLSMAEAVHRYLIAGRQALAVVGTHGKTTTTALAAHTLTALGAEPGLLVGGIAKNFGGNFRLGGGRWFVIEGDEYDTAYFDKTPKFFKYRPKGLLFTSLEFDHGDIYPDLATIRAHFARLIAGLPGDGLLVACADDPEVAALAAGAPCRTITYGRAREADCRLEDWRPNGGFSLRWEGRRESWLMPLPGLHNALNATAVRLFAGWLGFSGQPLGAALATFAGVKRRQEVRGEQDGVTVIDDFAHHPSAVAATIEAIGFSYPERRVWAVFEPRSFTARGARFQTEFGRAFLAAGRVLLAPPFRPAHSAGQPELDTGAVAAYLTGQGVAAQAANSSGEILTTLLEETRAGDVVLIMSNGSFDNLHERLLDGLRQRSHDPLPAAGKDR